MKSKKILSLIMATMLMLGTVSMTACETISDTNFFDTIKGWFDKTDEETPDDSADETPDNGAGENTGGETPDNGAGENTGDEPTSGDNIVTTDGVQYLRAGGTYNLSKSIAFLSTDVSATSSTTYQAVTSTLTATVEPVDAYQLVDWTYTFKNPTSTWAKGKKLSDYVTIKPKSDGSTKLDVTCKQPFGEPIEIMCMSRANNNIKATAVVDFLGVPELQTVTLGSGSYAITVNLGGETTVPFNYKGTGYGGELAVGTYKSSSASVYTKLAEVDDYDVFNFDLVSPGVYYNRDTSNLKGYEDGYLTADVDDNLGTALSGDLYDDLAVGYYMGQQYFWTRNLETDILVSDISVINVTYKPINDYDTSKVRKMLNSLSENSLYTFVLHVEVGGAVQTYYSIMKLQLV